MHIRFSPLLIAMSQSNSPPFRSRLELANLDLHEESRVSRSKAVSCDESRHLIAVDSSLFPHGLEVNVTTQWKSLCMLSEAARYANKALVRATIRRIAEKTI